MINIGFLIFLGSYLESYEGAFSSFLHGTYTKPCSSYLDINNHFLVMWIYEYISTFFPNVQVYGVIMFAYNWISISILGVVLYRILNVNIKNNNTIVFILLYFILCVDNFVNLSSTRIAFTGIVSIFGYIESCRFEEKEISFSQWIIVFFLVLFFCLMRAEAIILFSVIYLTILFIYKRFYKAALLPLLLSCIVFLAFNIIISAYSSEAKKVFIFKEKEIVDRNNFNYETLPESTKLDLLAFIQYGITDKEHFTLDFYNKIADSNLVSSNKTVVRSFIDGFQKKAYFSTLRHSIQESYSSWCFILCFILSGILLLRLRVDNHKKHLLFFIFILFFPFVICINTIVPLRFLVPYFSVTACINILIYLKISRKNNYVLFISAFCLLFILYYTVQAKRNYLKIDATFKNTSTKLELLAKQSKSENPIIINIIDYEKYFPVKPLDKMNRQQALFLNFFYHGAYDFYINGWKDVCGCNSFSLKEKVDYIVSTGNLFLIDDYSFEFLQKYLQQKYHLTLIRNEIGNFDADLKICTLKYR